MSEGKAMDAERIAPAFGWPAMPAGTPDLLVYASYEMGMAMYRHWLGAMSRLLQDQANHLQNLAECDNPLNVMVYQTEFAEKSVTAGLDELRRGVDALADTAHGQRAAA